MLVVGLPTPVVVPILSKDNQPLPRKADRVDDFASVCVWMKKDNVVTILGGRPGKAYS